LIFVCNFDTLDHALQGEEDEISERGKRERIEQGSPDPKFLDSDG
jgi:hypothetical protein